MGRRPNQKVSMLQSKRNGLLPNGLSSTSQQTSDDNCFNSPKRKECKIEGNKKVLRENGIANDSVNKCNRITRSTKTMNDFFPIMTNGKLASSNNNNNNHVVSNVDDENTCDSVESENGCLVYTTEQQTVSRIASVDGTEATAIAPNAKQSKQQKLAGCSETTNLFLQEPVLKLDIDKTNNVHCIKSSFLSTEIKTKFQTLPPTEYINKVLNVNAGSPQESRIISPERRRSIDGKLKSSTFLLNTSESNSCDSGVVISNNSEEHQSIDVKPQDILMKTPVNNALNGRRRKPTTPHRILCPSPLKNVPNKPKDEKGAAVKKIYRSLTTDLNDHNDQDDVKIVKSEITETKKKIVVVDPATASGNKKVTEYFPVRRSVRKTKKEVQEEQMRKIEKAILEEREDGLAIKVFDNKGRGIVTTRPFQRGEFVVEYIGDLIAMPEANKREKLYAEDDNTGCYMYYFKYNNQQYCIDATAESGKLGRLVNHSRNGNLITKTVCIKEKPHLVLIAKDDLPAGVELTYDYGDRSKEALQHHPWLAF